MRRASSALLAAAIVSSAALAIFASLLVITQRGVSTSASGLSRLADYLHQHDVVRLISISSQGEVRLRNLGSKPVEIEYLVIRRGAVEVVKLLESDECRLLEVNGECSHRVGDGVLVAVVTKSGVIVFPESIEVELPPGLSEVAYIIPITFSFNNLEGFLQEFDVKPELIAKPYPGAGRKEGVAGGASFILAPGREYLDSFVTTQCPGADGRVAFGVLLVGYDPSWVRERTSNPAAPPRFSILVAGPKMTGGEAICVGNVRVPFTAQGFRIKISNFTGTIKLFDRSGNVVACSSSIPGACGSSRSAIGVWYYGLDPDSRTNYWSLYLEGFAGYVGFYQRAPEARGQESSYEPYLFIGDVDGNGVIDILFITEDAYYGSSGVYNERDVDLLDLSTKPLMLRLLRIGRELGSPDGSIDGGRFSGIVLYLNLAFHDNSHPDENQLEDIDRTDWVLRVLLVDEHGNEYIVREYRYQEICNYHKTLVRDVARDNHFTKLSQSIFIPIPPLGRYWVVIAIQDPYYYDGYRNDADVTVWVEIIGVLPLAR